MALKTLNYSIFKLVGGLVCLTTLAILIAVWIATTNHARTQVAGDLDVGQRILTQILISRENQLSSSADVLTADFGFKQSVATHDSATITSALENHSQRISADIMALLSLSGEIISVTPSNSINLNGTVLPLLLAKAVNSGSAASIVQIGNKLYQVIMLTVDAPRPIAVALVGFELNSDLLAELKTITKLDITLQTKGEGASPLRISSLPKEHVQTVLAHADTQLKLLRLPFSHRHLYVSKDFVLSELGDNTISVVLSEDLNHLFAEFNALQFKITLISAVSIVLALLLGAVFSKNLTLPITHLSAMAQRISRGDYFKGLSTKANTQEINNLSIAFCTMQDNIREREAKINYQAKHDLLTNLFNRYQISEVVRKKIDEKKPFQAIAFNIVGFRSINDTFGYQNGDACLKSLAERILALGGDSARLNGGEILWLPQNEISQEALFKIRCELEQPHYVGELVLTFKLAVGLVRYPVDAQSEEVLFRRLNIAIEQAQREAYLFQLYKQELEAFYLKRLDILAELKNVLNTEQSELSMFYQPKLNTANSKIEKAEALIRWNSAKLGFVSPELFIPIAEQAGIIEKLTDWVIRRVIRDVANWHQQGVHLQVAINLSVHDVANEQLLPKVIQYLQQAELNSNAISFELTESDLMKEPEQAIKHLNAIREYGFGLAIDDFGTGYSSLAYLKEMPVTELKIDKSFVLKLATDGNDQSIVKSIISLANSFDLEIVAEGVEDQIALDLLQSWGCQWIQGYYINRPVSSDALLVWLAEQEKC